MCDLALEGALPVATLHQLVNVGTLACERRQMNAGLLDPTNSVKSGETNRQSTLRN